MPPTPIPTLTHTFPSTSPQSPSSTLQLLQHLTTSLTPPPLTHALIFLGGLGDTPLSIPYVRSLATSPVSLSEYTIFELRLSSSSSAFGYSSLKQDASEIRDCVLYLRSVLGVQKIVLMGHSTGCQDCLEYALNYGRASEEGGRDAEEERVDGVILQGPVSDREAIGMSCGDREVEESLKVARELIEQGKEEEIMPKEKMPEGWRGSPVSAYRWWSLAGVG
ncbi:hypothetical protein QBC44DRAFT_318888 [Cladorrhinum sp. PSN332]|nr:hypothetical protein QBC44DRAFT_318888 [Cladorrhinum sp. PSN332]